MYKRDMISLYDYSDLIDKRAIYRCKKDIKCSRGQFSEGDLVMLDLCSTSDQTLFVIDLNSVLEERTFDITNEIDGGFVEGPFTGRIIYDTTVITSGKLTDYFIKEEDASNRNIKHGIYIIISGIMAILMTLIGVVIFIETGKHILIGIAIIAFILMFIAINIIITCKHRARLEELLKDRKEVADI